MKTKIALYCATSLLMAHMAANADINPSAPSSVNLTMYSGYTLPFPGKAPDVTPASLDSILPYGMVTAQDIYPLMTGYSLTSLKASESAAGDYDGAFVANTISNSQPIFSIATPVDLTVGSMLANIPSSKIDDYYNSEPKIFPDFDALQQAQSANGVNNSAASYAGANVAKSTNVYQMNSNDYDAPYNAASLFTYMNQSQLQKSAFAKDYLAYQQNPGQVYIALASGGLTPPPAVDNAPASYLSETRRIAAIQTAGVYALQQIFSRSLPLKADNPLIQTLQGYPGPDKAPQSERELEKFMARRRLDPASGWYQHIQQASPTELQREQLYLEAENLYELHKVHETEERNEMLLAASLLSQNYDSRMMMNQLNTMQAGTARQGGGSNAGKQKASNDQNSAANFAKQTHLGS